MSRAQNICRAFKICAVNIAKFVIDLPYFYYLYISSILIIYWKRLTSRRKDIADEIILITGAASGLGQHITLQLANLSSKVVLVLWDINQTGLEETAEKCRNLGVHCVHVYIVDISNHTDVVRTASLVRHQVGTVSMLINNAGISPYNLFLDSDAETEERVLRVNLLSQMWLIREVLPEMIQKGKGHLISTCSGLGLYRFRFLSSYVASKHGLRGFMETLKLEMKLHPQKPEIKFTVIYPGWIKTPMSSGVTWESRYEMDMFKHIDPESVAERVMDGILRDEDEIFVPSMVKKLMFLQGCMPTRFTNKVENYLTKNIRLVKSEAFTV